MIDIAACRAYLQRRKRQRDQERETLRQQIMQAIRTAVPPVLAAFPQVRRAYVFGSMVRPEAILRDDSDIDVAIEGTLDAETYFALWREMERAIPGRIVEVVELGQDPPFAERVRRTGVMIYERADSGPES